MKAYDTYKDSGVQWLGEIPSHWKLLRNKNIFSQHYEPVEKRNDIPLLSLSIDGVKLRDTESGKGKFPKDFEKYNVVYPNQIIFCLFDVDETPRTVGLCHDYGMITNAYSTFNISDDVLAGYITYYYLAIDDVKALRPYYSGLRKVVQSNRFMQLKVPIPPIAEQEGIVAFLDEKTAAIDDLVAQVEREIELLKEFKQAEIARVVTKGLNPNAPMKPSGIAWIGDIPQHWSILRNKNLFESHYEPVGDRKDIPLLSLTTDGVILRDVDSGKGKFPRDFEKYNVVYSKQIIFCLFDIDETPRTVGLNHNYGMITNAYDTFNIIESNVLPRFITNYYLAVDNIKALRPHYTGLRKVVQYGKFMQLKVPVPPFEEQQEIVDYIDRKTTEIDRLVVELTYQVEYLKEYKQRLIADVVTGKINVQRN